MQKGPAIIIASAIRLSAIETVKMHCLYFKHEQKNNIKTCYYYCITFSHSPEKLEYVH